MTGMDDSLPPSIHVSQYTHRLSRSPTPRSFAHSYTSQQRSPSIPMSIPSHGRDNSPAPPPLPPPRHVQEIGFTHESAAAGWQWTNNPHWQGFDSAKSKFEQDPARRRPSKKESDDIQTDVDPTRRPSSLVTVTPVEGDIHMAEATESPIDGNRRLSVPSPEYRYDLFTFLLSSKTDLRLLAHISSWRKPEGVTHEHSPIF